MRFAIINKLLSLLLLAGTLGLLAAQAGDEPRGDEQVAKPSGIVELALSDPVSPSTPPQIYRLKQFRDEHGFPAGYALTFTTHVCLDEQCRMVKLTMHWDALGSYQRFEYPADTPLTKREHVPFSAADYAKLDQILKDPDSILGTLALEVLVGPAVQMPEGAAIDGWSGATPQTIQDSVVDDAAYTSWALWRWANGEIVERLRQLTAHRSTPAYLRQLLQSENRRHVDFALRHVSQHHPDDTQFVDDVFRILETGDREHVALALRFLHRAVQEPRQLHARLIEAYSRLRGSSSPMILDYFAAQPELPAETFDGLTGVLDQVPYFQVHLVLRLLDARGFFSPQVEANVARLLDHREFFIARRASEYLANQKLGADTQHKLDAFRQQHRQRL